MTLTDRIPVTEMCVIAVKILFSNPIRGQMNATSRVPKPEVIIRMFLEHSLHLATVVLTRAPLMEQPKAVRTP